MLEIIKLLEKLKQEKFDNFSLGTKLDDDFNEPFDLSSNDLMQDFLINNLLFELEKINYNDEDIYSLFLDIKKYHNERIKLSHKHYNEYALRAIPSISFRKEIMKILENMPLKKIRNLIKRDENILRFILTEISELKFINNRRKNIYNILKNEILMLADNTLYIDTKIITNSLFESIIHEENNFVIKYNLKRKLKDVLFFNYLDLKKNNERKYINNSLYLLSHASIEIKTDGRKILAFINYYDSKYRLEQDKYILTRIHINMIEFYDYIFIKEILEKYKEINNMQLEIEVNRFVENNNKIKYDYFFDLKRKISVKYLLLTERRKHKNINIYYKVNNIDIDMIKQMKIIVDNFNDESITLIFVKIKELLNNNIINVDTNLFDKDEKTINENGIKLLKIMMKQ